MSLASEPIAPAPPRTRSRVSNGSDHFLGDVDGRSEVARRWRDIYSDLIAHLGGKPSATEDQIAKRCASLAVWCERADSTLAAGGDLDIAAYTTASNSLRRLVGDLGLQARMRDITPSLATYLAGKQKEPSE